jgi:glycerol-3-phosphate acyltransferase PlsY
MSIAVLVLAVLLGSIPFGLLLTHAAGLGDIRRIGSGNIGATNVLRTGNKGLAAATLLLDGGKGAAALLIARGVAPGAQWPGGWDLGWTCGVLAVLAHCYSIWLRGRGGKGVATSLGVLLAGYWPVGIAACAIWLAAAGLGRRSSLASLVSIALAPPLLLLAGQRAAGLAALIILVQILIGHRDNIRRLFAGTEPRIGETS